MLEQRLTGRLLQRAQIPSYYIIYLKISLDLISGSS